MNVGSIMETSLTIWRRDALRLLWLYNDRARESAHARIERGEKITWHDLVDTMPRAAQSTLLKSVLRWRRRRVSLGINLDTWAVPRAELRDYLRQIDLPFFLRKRPMPESASATIVFRRPRLTPE